jgi:hypothetical protein
MKGRPGASLIHAAGVQVLPLQNTPLSQVSSLPESGTLTELLVVTLMFLFLIYYVLSCMDLISLTSSADR